MSNSYQDFWKKLPVVRWNFKTLMKVQQSDQLPSLDFFPRKSLRPDICRRPQRSRPRPCCRASKSRKSFGVCTLLRAHTNKANMIVQLHLSVHGHEVILWVRDVLVQHSSPSSMCQMQMAEMVCNAL